MRINNALPELQELEDPPQVQPQQQTFALAPGFVEINTPIDYSTSIGAESYWSGSSSLPIKFHIEEENLSVFTDALMDRARDMGWGNYNASILSIPILRKGVDVNMNLIEEFEASRSYKTMLSQSGVSPKLIKYHANYLIS